ncbi:phosphoribosyl 1,2-cyclic phosphate phosphodiesterase [Marchantia polymorpha subsp. ruderalis]|nr:hypothetical protein MARPO_0054s0026 [Marchantia polymorpha]BBN08925.1 hypothetical protein Mp_4g15610 [Marchantia polymorpha subsp. ruderalis]|eukprot:PTQ37911.1 hypothetical protein MARPO_0054s0026 [Marchantia polymorpha]
MEESTGGSRNMVANGFKDEEEEDEELSSELIFLGSGSSTGVPSPLCLLRPADPPCHVCHSAMEGPPEINKNYRCNPSLLINYKHEDGSRRYIQIDAGKNFKEQVLRWFLIHKVPRLDALLLTHEHADAMLGLDDIRGVQNYNSMNDIAAMPVFVSQHTMDSVNAKFPYLVEKTLKEGQEVRRVAQLDWRVIDTSCSALFDAVGLEITPLPVMHGEDYLSLGFLFGKKHRVAYISDVSRIPETTEQVISAAGDLGPVDILILDSLYKSGPHNTHFCYEDSLAAVKRLRPRRAFFVGMTHEFEHERDNAELAEWSQREGIEVQLAYDGMRIPVCLG